MSDSVRPQRRQPTRLPRPWDSPGKNTGTGCHFLLQCMKVKSESEVTQSCLTLSNPWTAAYQAPPSLGFSRQEYWSVFTSLPTSLHFFSASGIVLGLGRIRWEDLVPGPQEGGGLEGGFLWAICFIALPHSLAIWGIPQLGGQDVTFPP